MFFYLTAIIFPFALSQSLAKSYAKAPMFFLREREFLKIENELNLSSSQKEKLQV